MTRFPYQYPLREEERPERSRFDWLVWILLLLMVAAIVYLAPEAISSTIVPNRTAGEIALSENPEIVALKRFQAVQQRDAAALFARQNPELLTVQHYLSQLVQGREAFLAHNPEVRMAQRYLNQVPQSGRAFLTPNPELLTAERYLSQMARSRETFLAQNPELMAAQRYQAGQ